jgi:hypothetical protein
MRNLGFILRKKVNFLFSPNDCYIFRMDVVECSVLCRLEFVLLMIYRIWSRAISFLPVPDTQGLITSQLSNCHLLKKVQPFASDEQAQDLRRLKRGEGQLRRVGRPPPPPPGGC